MIVRSYCGQLWILHWNLIPHFFYQEKQYLLWVGVYIMIESEIDSLWPWWRSWCRGMPILLQDDAVLVSSCCHLDGGRCTVEENKSLSVVRAKHCSTTFLHHFISYHSYKFLVLRSQAHNYSTSLSYIILLTCCFFGVKLRNISHHIRSYIILLTNNLLLLGSQAQEYTVSHKK